MADSAPIGDFGHRYPGDDFEYGAVSVLGHAQGGMLSEFSFARDGYLIHRGRSSLFTVWASDDTTHPGHWWALDHHEPHFALVDGAAFRHDDLLRAFRAQVGSLLTRFRVSHFN